MYAIEFINITKDFFGIKANDNINISIKQGTIHSLIGENGAGKSTLMSILFGLYEPTKGKIKINDYEVNIQGPNDANKIGIGMVHQHFKLVDNYTNLQNIVLGSESSNKFRILDLKDSIKKIKAFQEEYNLLFDLNKKSGDATIATQQKVEILKMLYRDANILIFDEPTAVLTPQEIEGLLKTMKVLKSNGKTIIFISHKLNEIKEISDEVTVLRHGKIAAHFDSLKNTSFNKIANAMVGKNVVLPKNNNKTNFEEEIFTFKNVFAKVQKGIFNISFEVHKGEILAIAGIEGNGQEEIEYVASGLAKPTKGNIFWKTENKAMKNITKLSLNKRNIMGMSFVPGDRHKYGLILDFTVNENAIIRKLDNKVIVKSMGIINTKNSLKFASQIQKNFDVRGSRKGKAFARSLSGGNQQKAIVGRELMTEHNFIIIVQPTRGLDIGAIDKIHNAILNEKKQGKAILLISYELDEVLSLADNIIVVNEGKITGKISAKNATRNEIGLMMMASIESKTQQKSIK